MSLNSHQKFCISLKLLSYSIAVMMTLGLVVSLPREVAGETQTLQSAQKSPKLAKAEGLIERADKLKQEGNYREAIPLQEKALAIQEKVLGKEHPHVASTLNGLAELYLSQGIYAKVEPILLRSQTINEKVLGKEHPHVATNLDNLGKLYQARGIYAKAEHMYLRSLAIREKVLGKEHPKVATTLDGLLGLYWKLWSFGKFDLKQFKSLLLRSVAIREKILEEGYPNVAANLCHLATLYRIGGLFDFIDDGYDKAKTFYLRSLAIQEKLLGKEHPDVATTLNRLALLNHQNVKSETLLLRSLAIREKVLGREHPAVADALFSLGVHYEFGENHEKSKSFYLRSLAIREKVLGKEHPDVAQTLLNIAKIHIHFEEEGFGSWIDTATEPFYVRSLPVFEKVMGKQSSIVGSILQILANINQQLGNYTEAETLYLRFLAIQEKEWGKEHSYVAATLEDLAELYKLQGNYIKAESVLLRSLAIREKKGDEEFPFAIQPTLNYLGLIYNLQGNYAKAESVLLRSIAIHEKTLREKKIYKIFTLITLNHLGIAYHSQGNYTKAESILLRSLGKSEKYFIPGIASEYAQTMLTSLNHLAILYWAQGKISKTINFLSRRLAIEEKKLQSIYKGFPERGKQEFTQNFNESPNITISLALQQSAKNPATAKLAMTTVLRRKGRVLDAMTDIVQTLRPHKDAKPEIKKSFDEWLDIQQQLATLAHSERGKRNIEVFQQQIKQLQLEKEDLEHKLSFMSREFRKEIQPIELAPIQAKIPQNAALVEIVQYKPFNPKAQYHKRFDKPRYAAVVLPQAGEPKWVDLGDAATIDQSVENFRKALKSPASYYKNQGKKVSRELDKLIMAPIRPLLGDASHLLLSPDGQLNLIPFEALKDENNQYLVERYSFSYLTTGRDLLPFDMQAKQLSNPVVFADIDYEGYENAVVAKNTNSKNQRSVDFKNLNYDSLPGTSGEGKAIKAIFSFLLVIGRN